MRLPYQFSYVPVVVTKSPKFGLSGYYPPRPSGASDLVCTLSGPHVALRLFPVCVLVVPYLNACEEAWVDMLEFQIG